MRRPRAALLVLAGTAFAVVLAALLADRLAPPVLGRAQASALVLEDIDGRILDGRASADGAWRLWTERGDVDPAYLALLIRTEDRRFWWHPGVDPLALARSLFQLATRGRIVSGGSTLAMQTARLLEPHRHTLRGKLIDMLRGMQLEWRLGRSGVLDLYLTLAPEGHNIEGLRAASLRWFGHSPAHLRPEEAALLVALPRRPEAWRPDLHPAAALLGAARVLGRRDLALDMRLHPVPHDAPSLLASLWISGRRDIVRSTLDGEMQRGIHRLMAEEAPPARGTWAAIVVRPDATIAAWLGHAGNSCPGCAADMVTAWRSPGSTLKPFIYGLAFDRGLLAPDTMLRDAPTRFAFYAPGNFDRAFHGDVTVREALQRSYNIPAVRTLARLGPGFFAGTLGHDGAKLRLPPSAAPTLAIALGGAAIRPIDLARLYHALGAGGVSTPLAVVAPAGRAAGAPRLLTARAAHEVGVILAGAPRPPGLADASGDLGFKTGTSYGHRDAWAAGIRDGWTGVVWAGRPDGTASPGITGIGTAAPMLFQIFDLIPARPSPSGAAAPAAGATLSPALRASDEDAGPRIVSPPDRAELESIGADGSAVPIGLEASGGTEPYRWMVDNRPIPTRLGETPSWRPDGPGFAHLAVIDADGRAAAVTIRVR